MRDPLATVRSLLAGSDGADDALPPEIRLEFDGLESFGVAGVAARLAADAVRLTPTPHVVRTPHGLAVLDWDHAGRGVAIVADLQDELITRLWRTEDAREPVPRPSTASVLGSSRSRDSVAFETDTALYPGLGAKGFAALAEVLRAHALAPGGACADVLVLRAFGGDGCGAALLQIRGAGAETCAPEYAVAAYRYDDDRMLHLVAVPGLRSTDTPQ